MQFSDLKWDRSFGNRMGKGDRKMTGKEVMTGDAASIHQIMCWQKAYFQESC